MRSDGTRFTKNKDYRKPAQNKALMKMPPKGGMRFNPNAKLDNSQVKHKGKR